VTAPVPKARAKDVTADVPNYTNVTPVRQISEIV